MVRGGVGSGDLGTALQQLTRRQPDCHGWCLIHANGDLQRARPYHEGPKGNVRWEEGRRHLVRNYGVKDVLVVSL